MTQQKTYKMLPMSRILEKLVISLLVNSILFVTCRALLPYSKETISCHAEPDASSSHPLILCFFNKVLQHERILFFKEVLPERSVGQILALLGCYAAYVGSCLPTFQDSVSVPSSRVKQSMYVRPIGGAEISGNKHQHMLRNNQKSKGLIYTMAEA
jgi:hypothetical protein